MKTSLGIRSLGMIPDGIIMSGGFPTGLFPQQLFNGLVSAWDFEETGGIRRDLKGNFDLQCQVAVPSATGINGNGVNTSDGQSNVLGAIMTKVSPIGISSWSLSFWVKGTTVATYNYICSPIALTFNSGMLWEYTGGARSLGNVSNGVWYHVVFTYNLTANLYNYFVDGVNIHGAGRTPDNEYFNWSAYDQVLLAFSPSSDYPAKSYFDEVRLYDRVLTQLDVDLLYNSGDGQQIMSIAQPVYQETFVSPIAVSASAIQTTIEALLPGVIYNVPDGIYGIVGEFMIPAGVTVQAVTGARPIFVGTGGYPPPIQVAAGSTLDGLWFGGAMSPDGITPSSHLQAHGAHIIVKNCVFWGYYEGVEEGTDYGVSDLYDSNLFVNCGGASGSHALYLTRQPVGAGSTVIRNIIIGGVAGYQLHLFHSPTNLTITNNFLADPYHCIVSTGTGHTFNKNIIWVHRYGRSLETIYLPGDVPVITNNLFSGIWRSNDGMDGGVDSNIDGNYFSNYDSVYSIGINKTQWSVSQLESEVGIDTIEINNAVDSLRRAFFETPATIKANTDITEWISTIRAFMAAWVAYDNEEEEVLFPAGTAMGVLGLTYSGDF